MVDVETGGYLGLNDHLVWLISELDSEEEDTNVDLWHPSTHVHIQTCIYTNMYMHIPLAKKRQIEI